MTDYAQIAARIAAQKAATVQALQPAKQAAQERQSELWKAKREGRAIAQAQTEERNALDMGIPGFFPTPPDLAEGMIERLDAPAGSRILEPSAGNGHIAEAARTAELVPYCIEKQYTLFKILERKGFFAECRDFLEWHPAERWPYIAMNPPFERAADIEHVKHAFDLLEPGGTLTAIMSAGTFYRSDKKAVDFRAWLAQFHPDQEDLPAGTFKQSGTNVSSVWITIQKG